MSSTDARRYKRQKERDLKKGKIEKYLTIPTEQDVEQYISNKTKELTMNDPFVKTVTPKVYEEVK